MWPEEYEVHFDSNTVYLQCLIPVKWLKRLRSTQHLTALSHVDQRETLTPDANIVTKNSPSVSPNPFLILLNVNKHFSKERFLEMEY